MSEIYAKHLGFAKSLLEMHRDLMNADGPFFETRDNVIKLAVEFLRGALEYVPDRAEAAYLSYLLHEHLPRKPRRPDPHTLDAQKLKLFAPFQLYDEFDEMLAYSAGLDYPPALEAIGTDTDDPVRDAKVRARANWWREYLNAPGE